MTVAVAHASATELELAAPGANLAPQFPLNENILRH